MNSIHLIPYADRLNMLRSAEYESDIKDSSIPKECFKTWEHTDKAYQRRIVSAANRFTVKDTGEIIVISSARHYSPTMGNLIKFMHNKGIELFPAHGDDQGFIDQFDDYHTREEALVIAHWANQLKNEKCSPEDELFSEDLY